jgi:hypothetical protein
MLQVPEIWVMRLRGQTTPGASFTSNRVPHCVAYLRQRSLSTDRLRMQSGRWLVDIVDFDPPPGAPGHLGGGSPRGLSGCLETEPSVRGQRCSMIVAY